MIALELHAGFWIRLGANILDTIIVGIPIAILTYIFFGAERDWIENLLLGLYGLLLPVYFNGKTIGKHICKIRIAIEDTHEPPTLWTMIKRNLIFGVLIVLTCGIVCIVDVCFVIFREDKRALHDLVANTVVIEDTSY